MSLRDSTLGNALRCSLEFLGLGNSVAPFPIRRLAHPWRTEELSVPPGHVINPPDFVGVGTQKSGTSWWAGLIEQHPQVSPTLFGRKEMHFLTHFFERPMLPEDVRTYHTAFARPPAQKCGEWTPNYMASPYTLIRLRQAAPEAKVLVMLRDPIRRYESGYNHEYKQRFGCMLVPALRRTVIRDYALRKESIWMGMYGVQLEILLRHFPREQVLVLQYEQCRAEPLRHIQRTYAFLGLDPSFKPTGFQEEVNTQRRVVPPLSDETRNLLGEIYTDDVRRTAILFPQEIDLSLWPAFRGLAMSL